MGKHPETRGVIPPGRETERQANRVILNRIISFICIYFKTYLILFILRVPFVSVLARTFEIGFCHNKVWIQEIGKLQVASRNNRSSTRTTKCSLYTLPYRSLDREFFDEKGGKRMCKQLRNGGEDN